MFLRFAELLLDNLSLIVFFHSVGCWLCYRRCYYHSTMKPFKVMHCTLSSPCLFDEGKRKGPVCVSATFLPYLHSTLDSITSQSNLRKRILCIKYTVIIIRLPLYVFGGSFFTLLTEAAEAQATAVTYTTKSKAHCWCFVTYLLNSVFSQT